MPISRIKVNEYKCALCGYRWINRLNGKDGPIPKRCAKCKDERWEKGKINSRERVYRNRVKKRFGYWYYPDTEHYPRWRIEENAMRYLASRPSIKEIEVLLNPMCYLFTRRNRNSRKTEGCVLNDDSEHVDEEATKKANQYGKQLSRQLLKDLMTKRGIPYDENEAKKQLLYSRHGRYATFMLCYMPELCNELKKLEPELSNENIVVLVMLEVLFNWEQEQYPIPFIEDLIVDDSCWPDWLS